MAKPGQNLALSVQKGAPSWKKVHHRRWWRWWLILAMVGTTHQIIMHSQVGIPNWVKSLMQAFFTSSIVPEVGKCNSEPLKKWEQGLKKKEESPIPATVLPQILPSRHQDRFSSNKNAKKWKEQTTCTKSDYSSGFLGWMKPMQSLKFSSEVQVSFS